MTKRKILKQLLKSVVNFYQTTSKGKEKWVLDACISDPKLIDALRHELRKGDE